MSGWVPSVMNCWPSPSTSILCATPLGASKRGRHFRKRRRGAKRQRALRRAPEADEDPAAVGEQFLGHILGDVGAGRVGDVDVDRRRESPSSTPVLVPAQRAISAGVASALFCQSASSGALARARNGLEAIGLHGEAELGDGHEGIPPEIRKAPPAQCRRREVLLFVKVGISSSRMPAVRRVRLGDGVGRPAARR